MNLLKLVKIFCFSVVSLFCVILLIVGVLAASENTRAITFGQNTDMLVINQTAEGITLNKNNDVVFHDTSISNKILKDIIYSAKFVIPPLSSNGIWMIKSASECISYYFS